MPPHVQQRPDPIRAERHFLHYAVLIAGLVALIFMLELLERAEWFVGTVDEAELALQTILLLIVAVAAPDVIGEMRRRRTLASQADEARGQIEVLFKMTDMLQSALGHADANSVLRATASSLLPGFGGALYVFNNSGDRLELSASWNWQDSAPPSEIISPSDCWALKRGKAHLNYGGDNSLCCDHHAGSLVTMEIPMVARGEIYGLLLVERSGEDASSQLCGIASVAAALADGMSLSLSNLALREQLRTQALRDALTGLYNRRYMEDALERCADQANRNGSPLSIVMIDLDNFKKLNDEYGHAMGDAVLADVASSILGAIRPCDVACRYGGEELVVLLPDASLKTAVARAEVLRSRIERLSERHGVPISASLGVSTMPETSNAKDCMSDADSALYRAKQEGRNRVVGASLTIRDTTRTEAAKAA